MLQFQNHKNWLNGLIEDLENDPLAAVASPRIKLPNGKFEYEGWKLSGNGILSLLVLNLGALRRNRLTKKCYVNHGAGACILIKSAVLKQIGLFDERFSPFNYEDCDLFLRIKKAGYKVIYDPKYALNHGSSVSIKKYKKDKMLKYRTITGRNEIRFAYKHFPFYKIVPVLFVNLIRQFFDRDEGRLVMISYNPSSAIRLINEIDFGKEHVRISNKEAMNRIKKIYEI